MDNKSDDQLLIMQATIESNKKKSGEKMKNITEYLKSMITSTTTPTMGQKNVSKSSTDQKDSPKAEEYTTVFPAIKIAPPLESGHYTKLAS